MEPDLQQMSGEQQSGSAPDTVQASGDGNHTLVYIILIALVLLAVGLVIFIPSGPDSNEPVETIVREGIQPGSPIVVTADIIVDRGPGILERVASGVLLTDTEKTEIFTLLSGNNINKFGFSEQEKINIIEALNR
ncbi:hypothetical protein COB55_05880 [Candidatus Wolfebacteria bacterium]|nr:MAG: hypothetical protein COB55_05880 [Candidatus Wolfebacteria bacterium]